MPTNTPLPAVAVSHLLAPFVPLIPGQLGVSVLQRASEQVGWGVAGWHVTCRVTHLALTQVHLLRHKPAGSEGIGRGWQQQQRGTALCKKGMH
jgi:hypothetical protein